MKNSILSSATLVVRIHKEITPRAMCKVNYSILEKIKQERKKKKKSLFFLETRGSKGKRLKSPNPQLLGWCNSAVTIH